MLGSNYSIVNWARDQNQQFESAHRYVLGRVRFWTIGRSSACEIVEISKVEVQHIKL